MNPDTMTAQALLNCLVREVSGPENQTWRSGSHLMVRLARSDRLLRLATRRSSAGPDPRLTGEAQLRRDNSWHPAGWEQLARLVAEELALAVGSGNEEFVDQVRNSHAAAAAITRARQDAVDGDSGDLRIDRYVASEQALVAGHRFHPSPKAREGEPGEWLRYAPEARGRFSLRFLAVRDDALERDGDTAGLGLLGAPPVPEGYHVLPAHPWQLRLLENRTWLRQAFADGLLVDLGDGQRQVVPTSSVRTVYDPVADVFCKFSLNVRITNCVRKNSWYELISSVALNGLLSPVFDDLAARFPGTALLGEPGYRTAELADKEAVEGLSVIVRDGLRGHLEPDVTPLLAASLTEPGTRWPLDGRDPGWLLAWWEAYVRQVAPPVLYAYFGHGVVLEPHLQNVLVGMDTDGMPVQAIFRDLEGAKLLVSRHVGVLTKLKPGVARAVAYDPQRGWNRVAYCLLVNHLAEIAAAVADRHPAPCEEFEATLWRRAHQVLAEFAGEHGWSPQLRAVLAGVPLPAKANLRLRWARAADREATYVNVPNPMVERALAHEVAG